VGRLESILVEITGTTPEHSTLNLLFFFIALEPRFE
jgi:hypothetical protein